jgi:hypothetical protein
MRLPLWFGMRPIVEVVSVAEHSLAQLEGSGLTEVITDPMSS